LVIVVDSISFQFPITQLPISDRWRVYERLPFLHRIVTLLGFALEFLELGLDSRPFTAQLEARLCPEHIRAVY